MNNSNSKNKTNTYNYKRLFLYFGVTSAFSLVFYLFYKYIKHRGKRRFLNDSHSHYINNLLTEIKTNNNILDEKLFLKINFLMIRFYEDIILNDLKYSHAFQERINAYGTEQYEEKLIFTLPIV